MGIKTAIGGLFSIESKSHNPYSDESFYRGQGLGQITKSGVSVDIDSALRHQDVYTCVRIKSESIGQLPMVLYRLNSNGQRVKITSGREYKIFTQQPNSYQTWQEFIEMYVTAMELRGNFYAEIKRNKYNNVYEILPFKSQTSVSVNMDLAGRVYYNYVTNDSKSGQSVRTYNNNQILHIKGNSLDGFIGLSPISYTAAAIGNAIAGENHAASIMKNGARPSGILSTDEAFGDDEAAVARLRKQWADMHQGSTNSGNTAILEYGMKYQAITMTAVDTQLIEQRKMSREQIASIFRVPIHMLNAASGMKYNSIEHNNASFFRDSLMPLVTKLENNINLILPENHIIKVDEKQFVRGDRKAQVDNVVTEIKSGLMSVNEGRDELGHELIEGGDVFAVATNNLTFGRWSDLEKIQAAMGNRGNQPVGNTTTDDPDNPESDNPEG